MSQGLVHPNVVRVGGPSRMGGPCWRWHCCWWWRGWLLGAHCAWPMACSGLGCVPRSRRVGDDLVRRPAPACVALQTFTYDIDSKLSAQSGERGTVYIIQQHLNRGTLIDAGEPCLGGRWRRWGCGGRVQKCVGGSAGTQGCWGPVYAPELPRHERPTPLPSTACPAAAEKGWFRQRRCLEAPPNVGAMLRTLREVAAGMAYLHSRDIVHRDLTGELVCCACHLQLCPVPWPSG